MENLPVKKKLMIPPEHVLRFFISEDEQLDDLIILHHDKFEMCTTDKALYEAMGSIKEYDQFNKPKLAKFLEVVKILPEEKKILTHERVEQLRKLALKKRNGKI